MFFRIFSLLTRSINMFCLFFGILIQRIHSQKFESLFQLIYSLPNATTAASPLTLNNTSVKNDNGPSNLIQQQQSHKILPVILLILEVSLILVMFSYKLYLKWARNGGNFKKSWFKPKSIHEYHERRERRQKQDKTITDMINWIEMQQSEAVYTILSTDDHYVYATV